jgi:hypothetical protein
VHQDVDGAKVGFHSFGTFLHNIEQKKMSTTYGNITRPNIMASCLESVCEILEGKSSMDTEKHG